MENKITNCKTKKDLKEVITSGNIARVNWCNVNNSGKDCAKSIEQDFNAEVRGTLANKKELAKGKCIICNQNADSVVYIAKSY